MSAALDARAEIVKLARLLELDVDEIEYLLAIGPDDLRKLREQVTDLLFGIDAGGLSRLVEHSDLLPPQLVAAITKEAVGPFLTARIAGLIDPRMAVKVVRRLSTDFLVQVALAMDPRRAHDVIGAIPAEVVLPVTRQLARRREWIVMGSFVGHLPEDTSATALSAVEDEGLLKIAFVMEDKDQLGNQIALISDARLESVLEVAAEEGLWPEAIDLMISLYGEQRERVIDLVVHQPPEIIDSLIAAIHQDDLWEAVLSLVSETNDPAPVLDAIVRAPAKTFRAMVDAVDDLKMWDEVRELLVPDTGASRRRFFKRAAKLGLLQRMTPVVDLLEPA